VRSADAGQSSRPMPKTVGRPRGFARAVDAGHLVRVDERYLPYVGVRPARAQLVLLHHGEAREVSEGPQVVRETPSALHFSR